MDAEQKKAVARLKKMKVYKLIQVDPGRGEPTFDDWWFWVAFETDMLEDECRFDFEEYRKYLGHEAGNALTMRSFRSARKWMAETSHLLSEENRPRRK